MSKICAYFTLAVTSVNHREFPEELAKKLPHYSVPVILIGQLAVDIEYQGAGLGSFCLISAMKYAYVTNNQIPVYAVVVDALNDGVLGFYEKFGFRILLKQRQKLRPRLFLLIREVKRLFIN